MRSSLWCAARYASTLTSLKSWGFIEEDDDLEEEFLVKLVV